MKVFLEVTVEKNNVVSKHLSDRIEQIANTYVFDSSAFWSTTDYRQALESVLDEDIFIFANETKSLESWKVSCNDRNNPIINTKNNMYVLDIYYKQYNCLVTTHLKYHIKWYIISTNSSTMGNIELW